MIYNQNMRYMLFVGLAAAILAGAVFFLNKPATENMAVQASPPPPSPVVEQETNITAEFTIITNNLTRNFSSSKYHNQSQEVYIESSSTSTVHVKKTGITWSDFFNTLPIKLTKDCLTTGDGEKLCSDKGILKFYLNDDEEPNLLEKQINQGDKALIKYTSL